MELAYLLFIQCQISLQDIAKVLDNRRPDLHLKLVNTVYEILNSGSFEEYRNLKYKLDHLSSQETCDGLHDGSCCPLCPTDEGILIESMDACFGLARKRCKGYALDNPKHGTLFFADQNDIDNYVENYGETSSNKDQNCSRFHAGEVLTSLRSKGKNKLFDEKGVFGRVCRHDFPKGFTSVKHGERIAYSVYEVNRVLSNVKEGVKVVLMYDIACILHTHLKNKGSGEVANSSTITFAIPIFHCYGHKVSCQIQYSPRRIEGIGLTDGEGVERLWSYLRKFSKITKEMGPDKRTDVLTDGLLFFSSRLLKKTGPLLKAKLTRATTLKKDSDENLVKITNKVQALCSETEIKNWMMEEVAKPRDKAYELLWDEQYVELLVAVSKLKNITSGNTNDQGDLSDSLKRLRMKERSLATFERKNGIRKRWNVTEIAFMSAQRRFTLKKRKAELSKLHTNASERLFLLELKKKYADGQAIAIKLGNQITQVTKGMNKIIQNINSFSEQVITFDEVKDPSSTVFSDVSEEEGNSEVPVSVKRQLIELYNLKMRAEEEEMLVKVEMNRFRDFLYSQQDIIRARCEDLSVDVLFNQGLCSLLKRKWFTLSLFLKTLRSQWNEYIPFPRNDELPANDMYLFLSTDTVDVSMYEPVDDSEAVFVEYVSQMEEEEDYNDVERRDEEILMEDLGDIDMTN